MSGYGVLYSWELIFSMGAGRVESSQITGIVMICKSALENLFIFDGLEQEAMDLVLPLFHSCSCVPGEMIFEQGDKAEFLFIVYDGEVSIRFKPEDGPPMEISRVVSGSVFGWSAAFGSDRYTSGAFCEAGSDLIRVRGSDLKALCEEHPEIGILIIERLAAVVAERLQSTHAQVVSLLSYGLRSGVKPIGG